MGSSSEGASEPFNSGSSSIKILRQVVKQTGISTENNHRRILTEEVKLTDDKKSFRQESRPENGSQT